MTIEIKQTDSNLLLKYTPQDGAEWVRDKFEKEQEVTIRRIFNFIQDDIHYPDGIKEYHATFVLGNREKEYFRIDKRILDIKSDLYISTELLITHKTFMAHRDISIFRKIDELIPSTVYIGGEKENSIPIKDFNHLLKIFPTTTEHDHYAQSRISIILEEYFEIPSNPRKKYDRYQQNRQLDKKPITPPELYESELQKYEFIRDTIKENLKKSKNYNEKAWQKLMLEFILLIFPKYIATLENVHIKDFYSDNSKPTNRYIDIALVDASGHLDIIEIKQPFEDCILSSGKYRDNYTPKKELAGSIMQSEQYLFHLNKWGHRGEEAIQLKHQNDIPPNVSIKIVNPKAMVILGRSENFNEKQQFDFEIIKRKYANIIDILTYDDLLFRLDNIIQILRSKKP